MSQAPLVLLVEDNPITRKLVRFALQHEPVTLAEAHDGASAIAMINERRPDLILQDLLLPDMDGFVLAQKLREHPATRTVPILAFSGLLSQLDEKRVAGSGFTDFVTKPIEPSKLVRMVRAHLPAAEGAPTSFGAQRRIVLADDDDVQRKLSVFRLTRLGFEVVDVPDGILALEAIKSSKPEAVITDAMMPGLDGFGLCAAVRQDEALKDIPIVLVTSTYVDDADRELGRLAGATEFVIRTPDLKEMISALQSVLAGATPAPAQPAAVQPPEFERERANRTMVQLERQAAAAASARQQCAMLSAELAVLNAISEAITQDKDIDQVLRDILAACCDAGGVSIGALYLKDGNNGIKTIVVGGHAARHRQAAESFASDRPRFDAMVNDARARIISRATGSDLDRQWLDGSGLESAILVPLQHKEGQLGALVMMSELADLGADDRLVFAEAVGHQVSVALTLTQAFEDTATAARVAREHANALEAAQEQLMISDRMASIGMMAAGVGHEINNPLSAVVANLEMAVAEVTAVADRLGRDALGDLPDEIKEAYEAAQRVRRIAIDLKLFSGGQADDNHAMNVEDVLDSAVRLAWNQLHHRARVVKQYGGVPAAIGAESRLGQVFLNLIVNAAQAIPEGYLDANTITLSTRTDDQGRIVVDIADTGSGIAPDVMRRLFTPFVTTKPAGIGTGLGLSICRRLITAMGGSIWADSTPEEGTVFHVALQPAQAEASPPSAADTTAPVAAPAAAARVLVIDDEEMIRVILRRALKAHEITMLTNAKDALTQIAGGARFDAILCDVMMPGMTGIEFHDALSRQYPDQAAALMFLTGGAIDKETAAFLDSVPNAQLTKPFDVKKLRAAVDAHLTARRSASGRTPGQAA